MRRHRPRNQALLSAWLLNSKTMRLDDCPVRATLLVVGGKWKAVVLHHLRSGPKRFDEQIGRAHV